MSQDTPYTRDPATHVGIALVVNEVEVPCYEVGGDPAALSGLSVTWGRSTVLEMASATTCDFTLVDPSSAPGGVDYAALVYPGALVQVYAVAPDGARSVVFVGVVSDAVVTHDAGANGDTEVAVTAIDPSARLSSSNLIGVFQADARKVTLPAQSASARRTALRTAMDTGALAITTPVVPDGGGTMALGPWEADAPKVWPTWSDFYGGLGFAVWPTGVYDSVNKYTVAVMNLTYATSFYPYTRDISRASARVPLAPLTHTTTTAKAPLPAAVLRACDTDLDGTSFAAGGGLVDSGSRRVQVDYTDTAGEAKAVAVGGSSMPVTAIESQVNNRDDASEALYRWYYSLPDSQAFDEGWGVEGLTVDPDSVTDTDDFHLVMLALLEQVSRILRPVLLTDLPAWVPWRYRTDPTLYTDAVVGLLNGGTYTYDDGRWVLGLVVSVHAAATSSVSQRVLVTPGATVTVAHDDPRVYPSPSSMWDQEYATFADGEFMWSGSAWVAPLYVHPGDTVAVPHDYWQVIAEPETAWATDASALFSDGAYGWDGTAWVVRAPVPVPWGNYPTLAHDDPRWARPSAPWASGNYATFSDGPWRYVSGTAVWYAVTLVHEGDRDVPTPTGGLGNAGPVPHETEWNRTYVSFSTPVAYRRWTGTAWVTAIVVRPGTIQSAPSTNVNVVPEPHSPWGPTDYATLGDGLWNWDGTTFLPVTVVKPGDAVPFDHDDPAAVAVPNPKTAWANGQVATFTDGDYQWDGSGWAPAAWWEVSRVNLHITPRLLGVVVAGAAVVASDQPSGGPDGGSFRQAVVSSATTADVHVGHDVAYRIAVPPGETVALSSYVRRMAGGTARMWMRRYDASGVQVGADSGSPVITVEPGVWTRLEYLPVIPAGVASILVRVAFTGAKAAGEVLGAGMVLIEHAAAVGTWFDGDKPDTADERYAWTGTPRASTSTLEVAVPPLEVAPYDTPSVAHDDPNMVASPSTAWAFDQYATFTDGEWGWDGSAWQPVTWSVARTNWATDPRCQGLGAAVWSWNPGTGPGVATLTAEPGTAADGRAGFRRATITTPDTGGFSGHSYTEPVASAGGGAGDVVTVSMYVRPSVALTYTLNASTRAGAVIGDSAASAATPAAANAWTRLGVTITATKAYEGLREIANESAVGPAAGSTIDACCVLLEAGDVLGAYFDGSTPDTNTTRHAWTGTANASTSTESTPSWEQP